MVALLAALFLPSAGRATAATEEPDLLPPEQAFKFSARLVDPDHVEVNYRIADGYYMYRDKFRFSAEPAAVALAQPQLPAGKVKDDDTFGRVETYRGDVSIVIPFSAPRDVDTLTLQATSQGCADAGLCYMPQKQSAPLRLAALDAGGSGLPVEDGGVLSKLKQLTGQASSEPPQFLPVDRAFKVGVVSRDATTLVATLTPAKGYYLYRDKIAFKVVGSGASIARVDLPRGEQKNDANFGDTEVFHQPVRATLVLDRVDPAATHVLVQAQYQGCADAGLCYPPETKRFDVALAAATAPPGASGAGLPKGAERHAALPPSRSGADNSVSAAPLDAAPPLAASPPSRATGPADESSKIAAILSAGNFWLVLVSFLGFGILLSFTPCVFPMIPILSGIIVGQGHKVTRGHAFALSLVYVLGMAITYALAGVAAGLSGVMLSNALQNPWVLTGFAVLFVLLSLSMFGFYELQLPTALQSRLSSTSNRMQGGTFWGVLTMGVLSALIVGPCVAAPLAGALLYINKSRDALLGGAALFAMAVGMGVPLVAVGLSAGTLLPRAGAWMETIKRFFGVVLLGMAIWIVSPVIPAVAHMLAWAALLIVSAIYLHAIDPLPHNASGFRKLWKGVGVIGLLLGVALMIGALSGARDVLQPLAGLRAVPVQEMSPAQAPGFIRIASLSDLQAQLAQAKGRPVMLDFYADWCVSCKEMERFTFTDPSVSQRMSRMVLLKADVTAGSPEDIALLKRFGLFGPPGTVFFDARGRELPARVVGFQDSATFAASLDAVLEPS